MINKQQEFKRIESILNSLGYVTGLHKSDSSHICFISKNSGYSEDMFFSLYMEDELIRLSYLDEEIVYFKLSNSILGNDITKDKIVEELDICN